MGKTSSGILGRRLLIVLYLSEGELQTGSTVWQRERENSSFLATVTTGPDPGGVQWEIPSLLNTHRKEILLNITYYCHR